MKEGLPHILLAAALFALCWPLAYFLSDWKVYWGLWLLSVLFAIELTYLRLKHWEEI